MLGVSQYQQSLEKQAGGCTFVVMLHYRLRNSPNEDAAVAAATASWMSRLCPCQEPNHLHHCCFQDECHIWAGDATLSSCSPCATCFHLGYKGDQKSGCSCFCYEKAEPWRARAGAGDGGRGVLLPQQEGEEVPSRWTNRQLPATPAFREEGVFVSFGNAAQEGEMLELSSEGRCAGGEAFRAGS